MIHIPMPDRRWLIFAVIGYLLAALQFMPLRFAAGLAVPGTASISAKSVYGTIWRGGIRDLKAGAVSLGDIDAQLNILPLLSGRAEYDITSHASPPGKLGSAAGISGSIGKGWGSINTEHLNGSANFTRQDVALPLSAIEFSDLSVRFSGGVCRSASGSVRLILKPMALPGINTDGGFLGRAKCSAGRLLLPMASRSAMERADLTIGADGAYILTVLLKNNNASDEAIVSLAGFQPVAGGYSRVFRGRF